MIIKTASALRPMGTFVPGFGEMSKPLRLERKMMEPIFAKFVGKGQKVQHATLICALVACVAIVCTIMCK